MFEAVNRAVASSVVGRFFQLSERKATFSTELRAGVVTFLTVAYILAVNSLILADSGGPCSDKDCTVPSPGCRFNKKDVGFQTCLFEVRKSLVAATAIASMAACILMGSIANLPLALAPGMGINAYFTYNVVGYLGTGPVTYKAAMAAVFIEGWIFILLAISGIRSRMIQLVPRSIMFATSGGIGFFLAFIGLQTAQGIGLVVYEPATLVTLGGCPLEDRANMYIVANASAVCSMKDGVMMADLGPPSPNYTCLGNKMRSGSLWLGIMGGMLMVLLMAKRAKGAIMAGILFVTFISWIPNHEGSYLGEKSNYPGGPSRMNYFKKVVDTPSVAKTALAWDFSDLGQGEVWVALITFLYLDFLDSTGTLFSMASFINQTVPGFVNEAKEFPRQLWAFCVDGSAVVIGSLLGTSPVTVYIESAAGIKEGGRTGITALVVAFFFFISLFFTPIIASIPPYATGPALVLVGAMMIENVMKIDWTDVRQAVPCFLTMAVMPLTYSIAYGVVAGLGSYLFIYLALLVIDLIEALVKGTPVRDVLNEAIPEAFQNRNDDLTLRPSSPSKDVQDTHAIEMPDKTRDQV